MDQKEHHAITTAKRLRKIVLELAADESEFQDLLIPSDEDLENGTESRLSKMYGCFLYEIDQWLRFLNQKFPNG